MTGGGKPLFRLVDPDHPFFRRRWVRWATVLVPLVWAGAEAWWANWGWAAAFAAIGLYAWWMLIGVGRKGGGPGQG
mgnify:CR=1 FL=1